MEGRKKISNSKLTYYDFMKDITIELHDLRLKMMEKYPFLKKLAFDFTIRV